MQPAAAVGVQAVNPFRQPGDVFDPPGNADALSPQVKKAWSDHISENFFDPAVKGRPQKYLNDAPRAQFYNPLTVPLAEDAKEHKVVSWIGFPKQVKSDNPVDEERWAAADSDRNVQDEYCEWSVERISGKISRVTFTCEPPEYWNFLGVFDRRRLANLYREHISPEVKDEDLFKTVRDPQGKLISVYNPLNKWNNSTERGAMHLIQENNYLSAEIELAAGASIIRVELGEIVTEQQALINCGKYGAPGRNSDPSIGEEVNRVARDTKAQITLANPPGLYFDKFFSKGLTTPDGADPDTFWKVVRGSPDTPVRAVFEVPKERGYLVGDIKFNHKHIQYGSQIADFVRVKLSAVAQNFGKFDIQPMQCKARKPQAALAEAIGTPVGHAALFMAPLASPAVEDERVYEPEAQHLRVESHTRA